MVGRQLQVEPVGGGLPRGAHDAGVVDEHVDGARAPWPRRPRGVPTEVGEVDLEPLEVGGGHLGVDGLAGLVQPGRVAAGQDHPGAPAGQLEGDVLDPGRPRRCR